MIHNRYNTSGYNEARYNVEDIPVLLGESIAGVDTIAKALTTGLVDSVTAADTLAKQITSKVLTDSIRENDWATLKNADPQSDPWS